jgi:hypothetical protein
MTAVPPFHALYAAGFLGAASPSASPLPWPSPHSAGLGSRLPPFGDRVTTRQASLHVADWWFAPSLEKARPHASTPGSLRTPVGYYKGVLAPPSAGLAPASRHELFRTHPHDALASHSSQPMRPARHDHPKGGVTGQRHALEVDAAQAPILTAGHRTRGTPRSSGDPSVLHLRDAPPPVGDGVRHA